MEQALNTPSPERLRAPSPPRAHTPSRESSHTPSQETAPELHASPEASTDEFAVYLDVFSGPFEVLLSLISRKKLDITEVALAQVTDEFLAFVAAQSEADLSQVSEFVLVAATLLDLKAARLLPHEEADEEDMELLEARDLLFAKLLQYRAFKEVAVDLAARFSAQTLYIPRDTPLEEEFRGLLPEVELGITPDYFAMLAAQAFTRKEPTITLDHIHDPLVPVESQVRVICERIAVGDRMSFGEICRDARNVPTVVARFLAVLELLRQGQIRVEQESALAPFVIVRERDTEVTEGAGDGAAQSSDGAGQGGDGAASSAGDENADETGSETEKREEI